jgi:uncharacterized Zn-finger protein
MLGRWSAAPGGHRGRHHEHLPRARSAVGGPSLYEVVLRQAILTQYGLLTSGRHELRACEGCGKPYLLTSVWLPLSDDGTIACPRCGSEAVSWDGARGYLAYWQREAEPGERTAGVRLGYLA